MRLAAIDRLVAEGKAGEALRSIEEALAGELDPAERFELALKAGDILAFEADDPMASLPRYGEALQVAQEHGLPTIYRAELGIGQALHQQGRPEQALLYLEMAAGGAAAAGDGLARAAALSVQSDILLELGQYEAAASLMERVGRLAEELSNQPLQAQALATLALLQAYLGRYAQAEELGRNALALAKQTGDVGLVATAYLRMGQIMYQQDRFGPAYYWFKAGGDVAREAGLERLIQVFAEAAAATGVEPAAHDDHADEGHQGEEPSA